MYKRRATFSLPRIKSKELEPLLELLGQWAGMLNDELRSIERSGSASVLEAVNEAVKKQAETKAKETEEGEKIETNLTIANNKSVGSETFTDNLPFGNGWRVWQENGKWVAEFDRLRVRETMTVKELLFQQVRATNGSLWITSTGKIRNPMFIKIVGET